MVLDVRVDEPTEHANDWESHDDLEDPDAGEEGGVENHFELYDNVL